MGYYDAIGQEAEKMLEYVETGTTHSADASFEVPVSAYTDPEIFARERAEIFMKLPLLAGLSAEIPNPGDYKALEMLGKPVLITRRGDGSVAAMLNVCTHRGMILRPEGHGNARRFSCPYHAWTFGNDGKLIGAAEPHKFGPVCKEDRNLTALPVAEAGGIVWSSISATILVECWTIWRFMGSANGISAGNGGSTDPIGKSPMMAILRVIISLRRIPKPSIRVR